MTDGSHLPTDRGGDATLHRPTAAGGLEVASEGAGDYRDRLRSRRWNAAPLENPEAQKTDPRIAVLAIVILSAITLAVIVLGYASGSWSLG